MNFFDPGLFAKNKQYKSYDERIQAFVPFGSLISGAAHIGFIFLFKVVGVPEMMYFNIFISLPLILSSYLLSINQKVNLAWIIFCFEVAFHAVAAIYFIGWASGFQFYLISCVILIHLAYGWNYFIRWSISVFFLVMFLLSFFVLNKGHVYQLNKNILEILYVINILTMTIIASFYLSYFVNLVISFEKKLKLSFERLTQKNKLINDQKDKIKAQRDSIIQQKDEIERIHLEVSDSIDYAKRIQKSILPSIDTLHKNIKGLFVFYKPKYKVSGDFYWWANLENHTVIVAADCTGHGVPGAFMSMLGISYLREIVIKEYITQPAVILRKLRKEIVKSLKQKGESGEQKDGMDMAMVSINHDENIAQYAGANNPVYIVSKKQNHFKNVTVKEFTCDETESKLYEIKPDKMPIGIYQKMDKFTIHEFPVYEGDTIYLFSDGFADQFGGQKDKKFKYLPFKKLLLENSEKPLFEQKEILNNTYNKWKGDNEQIDDVVVLGFKV